MKITYILPVYWPAIGGCELHTHELVKVLSERHDINVITLIDNQEDKLLHEFWLTCILTAPAKTKEYLDNKAKVTRLSLSPIEKYLSLFLARIQSPRLSNMFIRYAMEMLSNIYVKKVFNLVKGADVLHCVHGGISYLGYASFKVSRMLGVPFVYTPVLHLHHKNWFNEMRECRKKGIKFIYNPELHLMPRRWTDSFWYKLLFEADAVVALTGFERDFYVGRGVSAERVHKVGVGPLVDEGDTIDIRQKYSLGNKKIILFLGRNIEYKGIEELLLAARIVWNKFPDTYFFFAGPKEGNSEEIFRHYCDPRIIVLGVVSENEKTALLKACDILCMPSLEESLGGVYLEAWSFGKPVLGANNPVFIELTEQGKGGVIAEPTTDDIANGIVLLLENPFIGIKMGEWGRRRVAEEYSWEIISNKIEEIYNRLCEKKK